MATLQASLEDIVPCTVGGGHIYMHVYMCMYKSTGTCIYMYMGGAAGVARRYRAVIGK